MAGYSENPELEIPNGVGAINGVFSLTNGRSASLYTPSEVIARFNDSKWYNIDSDSRELMDSQQGKFCIVTQQASNLTVAVPIPIYLNYEIEFMGNAVQSYANAPTGLLFPACEVNVDATNPDRVSLGPAAGEPPLPGTRLLLAYTVVPTFNLTVTPVAGETVQVTAQVIEKVTDTPLRYRFYESVDDYLGGEPWFGISTQEIGRFAAFPLA
jgi:hypothetical protein